MNQWRLWLVAGTILFGTSTPVSAATAACVGSCVVNVSADVPANLTFQVTITELIPDGHGGTTIGPVVTTMDFSDLASHGTFGTPPHPRALNSLRAYQVFFGMNSQQRPFSIAQTIGPLQSGPDNIKAGAFIVTPLPGVGGDPAKPLPVNITVGPRGTAVAVGKVLFSSSGGPSNTMAATYGITDDPSLGAFEFIPLDQPAGHYVTTVTYTATVT